MDSTVNAATRGQVKICLTKKKHKNTMIVYQTVRLIFANLTFNSRVDLEIHGEMKELVNVEAVLDN